MCKGKGKGETQEEGRVGRRKVGAEGQERAVGTYGSLAQKIVDPEDNGRREVETGGGKTGSQVPATIGPRPVHLICFCYVWEER